MHAYDFLKKEPVKTVSDEDKANFRLARADNADRIAAEWAAKGDETQAQRWRETAAALRSGTAA